MGGITESLLTDGVRIRSVISYKDSEVYSSEGKYSMSRPESKDLLFNQRAVRGCCALLPVLV